MDARPAAQTGEVDVAPEQVSRRLAFIDSLRGVAALYVLVFHMMFVSDLGALSPHWAFRFLINGGSGVTLFFIVSAFSLCHAHSEGFQTPGSIGDFYIRRAARIVPLFYAMLVFTLLHNAWSHVFPHPAGQIIRTAFLVFNLVPGDEDGIVPAAWSIGVEVMFYAIFPWLFARQRSLPRLLMMLSFSFAIASLYHTFVSRLPYPAAEQSSYFSASLPRRLPVFLLGMGTWMVFRRTATQAIPAIVGAVLIATSLCVYVAYIYGLLAVTWPEPYYWEAVVYSLALTGFSIYPIWPAVSGATVFCGRISYSIYLLHIPVIMALRPIYSLVKGLSVASGLQLVLCFGLTLGVLLPVATLSYRLVEVPGMKLGKTMLAWRQRRRLEAGAAIVA